MRIALTALALLAATASAAMPPFTVVETSGPASLLVDGAVTPSSVGAAGLTVQEYGYWDQWAAGDATKLESCTYCKKAMKSLVECVARSVDPDETDIDVWMPSADCIPLLDNARKCVGGDLSARWTLGDTTAKVVIGTILGGCKGPQSFYANAGPKAVAKSVSCKTCTTGFEKASGCVCTICVSHATTPALAEPRCLGRPLILKIKKSNPFLFLHPPGPQMPRPKD
jgi:hypothetical protein